MRRGGSPLRMTHTLAGVETQSYKESDPFPLYRHSVRRHWYASPSRPQYASSLSGAWEILSHQFSESLEKNFKPSFFLKVCRKISSHQFFRKSVEQFQAISFSDTMQAWQFQQMVVFFNAFSEDPSFRYVLRMSLYIYAYTYIYHICIGALEMHINLCYL